MSSVVLSMWSDQASIVRLPAAALQLDRLAEAGLGLGVIVGEEVVAAEAPEEVALPGPVAEGPVDGQRLLEHDARGRVRPGIDLGRHHGLGDARVAAVVEGIGELALRGRVARPRLVGLAAPDGERLVVPATSAASRSACQ